MSSVSQRASGFTLALASLVVLGLPFGVGGCSRDKIARNGQVSIQQRDNYMRDAVRQSSEGVVLEPSQKGLDQIERTRLNEIAQQLRQPGAVCFLERAIQTMERGEIDGEQVWVEVPEGQAKFRVRVSIDGTVLATELIESGFKDEVMEECLSEALTQQRFVESRDSFAYFIDVYYWVSLGFFAEAQTESFAELLRRQSAEAGLRARACLTGRVPPGEYVVTGLNLFDRDGRTVVNRIDRGELSPEVSACIASAFKQIHIHAEPDAFVRPAAPSATFTVDAEGVVHMADELWLERIELEERAQREMKRAELLGDTGEASGGGGVDAEVPKGWTDMDAPQEDPGGATPEPKPLDLGGEPPPKPEPDPQPKPAPSGDPTKPGTKINLSPRSNR